MFLSAALTLLIVSGDTGLGQIPCYPSFDVPVLHQGTKWEPDAAGAARLGDVAAYVLANPSAEVFLDSRYGEAGNMSVLAVSDALADLGILSQGLMITSGPRAPGLLPTAPEGFMEVSVKIDCGG